MHMGERLGKLEQLFERFVCRKSSAVESSSEATRSPTLADSSDTQSKFTFSSDAQSVSSLGEGIVRLVLSIVIGF